MTITLRRPQPKEWRYRPLSYDPCEGERARQLWLCVILQAVKDATAPTGEEHGDELTGDPQYNWRRRLSRTRKRHIIAWLSSPNADFAFVCDMAGIDPAFARTRALTYIENHDRVRRMIRAIRGYSTTLPHATGTGAGTRARHFQAGGVCNQLQIGGGGQ